MKEEEKEIVRFLGPRLARLSAIVNTNRKEKLEIIRVALPKKYNAHTEEELLGLTWRNVYSKIHMRDGVLIAMNVRKNLIEVLTKNLRIATPQNVAEMGACTDSVRADWAKSEPFRIAVRRLNRTLQKSLQQYNLQFLAYQLRETEDQEGAEKLIGMTLDDKKEHLLQIAWLAYKRGVFALVEAINNQLVDFNRIDDVKDSTKDLFRFSVEKIQLLGYAIAGFEQDLTEEMFVFGKQKPEPEKVGFVKTAAGLYVPT